MLPPALAHEVVQLGRAVARVLRAPDLDGLRAFFAPRVAAAAEGADDLLCRLVLSLVDEDRFQTPAGGGTK